MNLKRLIPDLLCVALFAAIAACYFFPADFDGRRLTGHDNTAGDGLTVELNNYRAEHGGETPRWINSIFGGMPTYQVAPSYDSARPLSFLEKAYHLWLPDYVWYVFASMLGFYILLRAFDFRQWMAALGAVAWAFSSYFFIIIAAGHIWKVVTLAYIPPTIAGMVMCYRGKLLWGGIVTAFFAALQIMGNHVQMTYYFLVVDICVVLAFLAEAAARRRYAPFLKATGVVAAAAAAAVALNASNLYHTYEYAKDTMRGKSELVKQGAAAGNQTDSGLERDYITNWSYGIGETYSLLVPNVRGGASVPLQMSETAMEKANPQFAGAGVYGAFTQYWGEQPGTSGPVYVGALVCTLFLLALFVAPHRSPMKWLLLLATLLSILLAWGRNFMPLTDWCIDHVPMYSKFRTVASILVVAEFTIPLLALLGLKAFFEQAPDPGRRPYLLVSLGVSAAFPILVCLCFALFPTAGGDCLSSADRLAVQQYVEQGYFDPSTGGAILASISTMRAAMLSADAWRSALVIAVGCALLYVYLRGAAKTDAAAAGKRATLFGALLVLVCLADMWQVNKRYLHDSMFSTPRPAAAQEKTDADAYILGRSGDGRNYRVLNYTVSTFNDNTTSYFYSSVGGYHPAKLRRYQELIEEHIAPEMKNVYTALGEARIDTAAMLADTGARAPFPVYDFSQVNTDSLYPVINMLNTRWFILGGQNGVKIPVENTAAYGNAWFVDSVLAAGSANEELDALSRVDLRRTAVVGSDFGPGRLAARHSARASIRQTALGSTSVSYEADSDKGGVAVFSEIYYPGWTATIDGRPADIVRANYVLRAMQVPAGKHVIRMDFDPASVRTTETIAYAALALLLLATAAAVLHTCRKRRAR